MPFLLCLRLNPHLRLGLCPHCVLTDRNLLNGVLRADTNTH